ncbi:protein kinase activating protein DPB11 KNAG_0B01830 [Huiozyma naganishii CBS 8797]|uniref:BRCT domain-containing protein n=1 Tax=Huiozyma naganishii (strain ATCC MYA-139 / BCRC 22969 / CBS 8797 / KCTC 17520 / NBRC 10181 / NCYC 3082 / Yp74L-3) TaxID=1071383 RepID=J7S4K2_HUIN7|nr:hypothetical protein KNAG_0B01830 [Kazachstania naganishii CBS 8797]CCK68626.1 hypothetical protein KNAG_0B01830 [Kazachstania naganishii CBS 8797]
MKPFSGITFCPTGIEEELSKQLRKRIYKLGGEYTTDLMTKVNVIILNNNRDTTKYKFAIKLRPDIVFVESTIVNEIYELWINGEDVTMADHFNFQMYKKQTQRMLLVLQSRYSALPFENYYIFIGRIQDEKYPVPDLERIAKEDGCFKCVSKYFVKDAKTTNPSSNVIFISDTLHGVRIESAMAEDIPIVHPKWIMDCHRRHGTLEYDPFYLTKNVLNQSDEQIGLGACNCWPDVDQRFADQKIPPKPTDNDDLESSARPNSVLLNKFKPEASRLWKRAFSVKMPKTQEDNKKGDFENEPTPQNGTSSSSPNAKIVVPEKSRPIFENCTFTIHPKFTDKHATILIDVIKRNGGVIMTSDLTYPDYLLVPSSIPVDELRIAKNGMAPVATEFFIERCLHYKQLITPVDSWSKPFLRTNKFSIKPTRKLCHNGDSNLHISISGFQGVELLHLKKILKQLSGKGVTYSEYLNNNIDLLVVNLSSLSSIPTTHVLWNNKYSDMFKLNVSANDRSKQSLVCRNFLKMKLEYVKDKHAIPVVTPAFLMELLLNTANVNHRRDNFPKVHINNFNWCISCPKGNTEQFSCEIINDSGSDLPGTNQISGKPPSKTRYKVDMSILEKSNGASGSPTTSLRAKTKEVLDKIKASNEESHKRSNTESLHSIPHLEKESKVDTTYPSPKRQKLSELKRIEPINRTSSWGNMMSNDKLKQGDVLKEADSEADEPYRIPDEIAPDPAYTQIGYGVPKEKLSTKNPLH